MLGARSVDVLFTTIESVGFPGEVADLADEIRTELMPRIATTKADTHIACYSRLPGFLHDLGLRTRDGLVHFLLLPPGREVAMHAHDWPAMLFFPVDHDESFWCSRPPLKIDTVAGRLILVPADLVHWVNRNSTNVPRLSIAGELMPDSTMLRRPSRHQD